MHVLHNLRTHVPEIIGTVVSGSGAGIATWQAQAQWGVSIIAGLVAIIAGALTIRSLLRKENQGQEKAR